MNIRTILPLATALTLMITLAVPVNAAVAAKENLPVPTAQELSAIAADPGAGIRLKGIDGTWACATAVDGHTYRQQLDSKLEYIEETARKENGRFLITEDVSEQEALNTAGIRYLYAHSETYRQMCDVTESVYLASAKFTFSKLAEQETSYERWAFYVDGAATLSLNVAWQLKEGKMAVWLISPQGVVKYRSEAGAAMNDTLQLDVEKGLWSVILVQHYDDNQLSGSKNIQGSLTVK